MAQSVTCLSHNHKGELISPGSTEKAGVAAFIYNPKAGEAESGGSLGFRAQTASSSSQALGYLRKTLT